MQSSTLGMWHHSSCMLPSAQVSLRQRAAQCNPSSLPTLHSLYVWVSATAAVGEARCAAPLHTQCLLARNPAGEEAQHRCSANYVSHAPMSHKHHLPSGLFHVLKQHTPCAGSRPVANFTSFLLTRRPTLFIFHVASFPEDPFDLKLM